MRRNTLKLGLAVLVAMCGVVMTAQAATITVSANITADEVWTADNEYVLDFPIYITNGATLTIEAGTVVRGQIESAPGANDPGTLVVSRDGRLNVLGTALDPVVFTDEFDDNIGDNPGTPPYDNKTDSRTLTQLWGGLVALGYGYVANGTGAGPDPANENQIEGLTATGELGFYGGCAEFLAGPYGRNCDDGNSGTFNYFSLRYGGFNLSPANEINGLTLGGVGRATDISHFEIINNFDDGVEFFGGAANIKYGAIAFVGDDSIDYDEGWRGSGQFIFVLNGSAGGEQSDKGGEHDGGISPDDSQPFAIPTFSNVTSIGKGSTKAYSGASGNTALKFRDNAGGRYFNSYFAAFGGAWSTVEGTSTEPTGAGSSGERSITPFVADGVYQLDKGWGSANQLELNNNVVECMGSAEAGDPLVPTGITAETYGGDSGKTFNDPGWATDPGFANDYVACGSSEATQLREFTRAIEGDPTLPDPVDIVDPRPAAGSSLLTKGVRSIPAGGFFEQADFVGAFGGRNWLEGWSLLDRLGYFPDTPQQLISANVEADATWTPDNEYVLDQPIYVTNGATLTIEACTVVRGQIESAPGANDPGTLVASRDGKINILGTADCPVVFTDEFDDNVGNSRGTPPYNTITDSLNLTQQWGGLVALGYGYVANGTGAGPDPANENQIEGLTATGELGFYGGCSEFLAGPYGRNCDDGDSGTMQYFSLRYGGFNLSPANEINGLTLGGVGRATDIDHFEIMNNFDDGVEFFGGAANIRYGIIANVGDDSIDYDEGWRGSGQFIFVMNGSAGGEQSDKGGEHDGGISPDDSQPFAIPTLSNVTFVGKGAQKPYSGATGNTALKFRDNAGGRYFNSYFSDFGGAWSTVEGTSTEPTGAGSSGERSITPFVADGVYQLDKGWGSANQLELASNVVECMGSAEAGDPLVPTGVTAETYGGDSGKAFNDPGWATDPAFDNTILACGAGSIRTLVRTDSGDPSLPDQTTSIDPRPAPGSALNGAGRVIPAGGFFVPAPFKGAFSTANNWAAGWSTLARLGYFPADAAPNEATSIGFSSKDRFAWTAAPGGNVTGYDVLRSTDPADFTTADCVESNDGDTYVSDPSVPAAGTGYYYLVRATNRFGAGSLGLDSAGNERTGTACP